MATVISQTKGIVSAGIPSEITRLFPYRLREELMRISQREIRSVEEIRLRSERRAALTTANGNIRLESVISKMELDNILQELCEGSLYAHSGTINEGYVTLPCGVRVGVCGRAAVENGKIIGVYSVSGMNFRIPSHLTRVGLRVAETFLSHEFCGGILVYSPPGVGKTTLLRNVAAYLAERKEPLRVAVVDTRGEFSPYLSGADMCVDIFSAYPKAEGITIAARTMNAQVIICDEIGGADEVHAIISAQNCGVPLMASAHADNVSGLLRRPQLALLHEARVFGLYVGISRTNGGTDYSYTVHTWEKANDIYKNYRSAFAGV